MGTFTVKIDTSLWVHYNNLFKEEDCVITKPQYTFFQAKNKNWQVSFYTSGKVLVQGKDINYIVQKYFDESFEKNEISKEGEIAPYPHMGIDESGKGDFFGPLVVAGCFLTEQNAVELKQLGAMDSKKLDDKKILLLAQTIKEKAIYDVVVIGNKKYNELYSKFKNLNCLLAWGHSTVLENILNKTECNLAISDKFGDEKFIKNALKEKGSNIKLIQQTKAEQDTAVACASILARAEFVKRISLMSKEYEMDFPKGANDIVLKQGEKFVQKFGFEELKNVSKSHFKTTNHFKASQAKLF